jgi:hypothetical protein
MLKTKMSTFAEKAIVDHRSSLAAQGKQTSVFRFRLHQTKVNCRLLLIQFFL